MIAAARHDALHREPVLHRAAHRRRAREAPGRARRARDRAGAAAASATAGSRSARCTCCARALIQRLRKADRHGRFRVYYPHVPRPGRGLLPRRALEADDRRRPRCCASARRTSCNRSMALDTECDVAIEARGDAAGRRRDPRLPRSPARRAPGRAAGTAARGDRRATAALHGAIEALARRGPHAARARRHAGMVRGRGATSPRSPIPTSRSRSTRCCSTGVATSDREHGRCRRGPGSRCFAAGGRSRSPALWRWTPLAHDRQRRARARLGQGLRRRMVGAAGGDGRPTRPPAW